MTEALPLRTRTAELLDTADRGDTDPSATLDTLVPIVYDQLRAIAHRQRAREAEDHTLDTTALVNEAYLRLVDDTRVTRRGRAYFFGAAARAMRQILVDYARRRDALKRGGGMEVVTLEDRHAAVDGFAAELLDSGSGRSSAWRGTAHGRRRSWSFGISEDWRSAKWRSSCGCRSEPSNWTGRWPAPGSSGNSAAATDCPDDEA